MYLFQPLFVCDLVDASHNTLMLWFSCWSRFNILFFRFPGRLGKSCCKACPSRLVASGGGLSGGWKARVTLKEWYLLAAECGPTAHAWRYSWVVLGALGMVTYDSCVFLGSSGGTAMLSREGRARRQAPPQAILRRSLGLRGGHCASRRLDSTTKEEDDWASTGGEEADWTLPEGEFFVFQINTASCEEHLIF